MYSNSVQYFVIGIIRSVGLATLIENNNLNLSFLDISSRMRFVLKPQTGQNCDLNVLSFQYDQALGGWCGYQISLPVILINA